MRPAPTDYLSWGPGWQELSALAAGLVEALVSGRPATVTYTMDTSRPAYTDIYGRLVTDGAFHLPAYAEIPVSWAGTNRPLADALGQMLAVSFIHRQQTNVGSGKIAVSMSTIAEALARELPKLLRGGATCRRTLERGIAEAQAAGRALQRSGGSWCRALITLSLASDLAASTDCSVTRVCDRTATGAVVAAAAPVVTAPPPPGAPPALPTRAEIEAGAVSAGADELAWLSELQDVASLVALATLVEGLGLPPGSSLEDMAARLIALGIAPDEAMGWLAACNYDPECFRQTMNRELYLAGRRTRDIRAGMMLGGALLVTAGLVIAALRRRR